MHDHAEPDVERGVEVWLVGRKIPYQCLQTNMTSKKTLKKSPSMPDEPEVSLNPLATEIKLTMSPVFRSLSIALMASVVDGYE